MTIEHKVVALTDAAVDSDAGTGKGYGAIFGNRDDGGDIIKPGFFKPVLADFLSDGFMSWSHRWDVPVAFPTKAVEDASGLDLGWTYHSTPEAQVARTIASERLAAGKSMGLSIGYEVAEEKQTPEGRLLLKAKRLFEVGLVMVPMNREAGVLEAKTAEIEAAHNHTSDADREAAPELVLPVGLTYAQEAEYVFSELAKWRDRTVDLLTKESGPISASRRDRLGGHVKALEDVLVDLRGLLDVAAPPEKVAAYALRARARMAVARAEYGIID